MRIVGVMHEFGRRKGIVVVALGFGLVSGEVELCLGCLKYCVKCLRCS